MIQIQNLSYYYGNETALSNINIHIHKKTTCAVIGPSGCGKTTLLYIIAGLLRFKTGQVEVDGKPLQSVRSKTGIILQNRGLLPWKTVWDNIALGLISQKLNKDRKKEIIEEVMRELNIEEHKDKFPSQLSGGQVQRTAIARTLVTNPDLLLLDEAFSALDIYIQEKLQSLILELHQKKGITLITVTHSIDEAVYLGHKIIIMERSKIKHILHNPHFGDNNFRSKPEYYEVCSQVRGLLNSGDIL